MGEAQVIPQLQFILAHLSGWAASDTLTTFCIFIFWCPAELQDFLYAFRARGRWGTEIVKWIKTKDPLYQNPWEISGGRTWARASGRKRCLDHKWQILHLRPSKSIHEYMDNVGPDGTAHAILCLQASHHLTPWKGDLRLLSALSCWLPITSSLQTAIYRSSFTALHRGPNYRNFKIKSNYFRGPENFVLKSDLETDSWEETSWPLDHKFTCIYRAVILREKIFNG